MAHQSVFSLAAGDPASFKEYIASSSEWIRERDTEGQSILHVASRNKQAKILETILATTFAIDVDITDDLGNTALHYACREQAHECIKILIGAGSNTGKKNLDGKTPREIAPNLKTVEVVGAAEEEMMGGMLKVKSLDTGESITLKDLESISPLSSTPLVGFYQPKNIGELHFVIPREFSKLKKVIRAGVPAQQRRKVWLVATGADSLMQRQPGMYERALRRTFRSEQGMLSVTLRDVDLSLLPHFGGKVDPDTHNLPLPAVAAFSRLLMCIAQTHPEVEFCPALPDIVCLLLGVLQEDEVFAVVSQLLSYDGGHPNDAWHLPQNKTRTAMMGEALRDACGRWAPDANRQFLATSIDPSSLVAVWFNRFFCLSLPYHTTLRVLDCYLLEGNKILYRVALAIFRGHTKTIRSLASAAAISDSLAKYTATLSDPEPLLKAGFGIRNMPKKSLNRFQEKNPGTLFESHEGHNFYMPIVSGTGARALLNTANVLGVWRWLPTRLRICDAHLLFDSARDGYSLATLLAKAEFSGPNLILIQTTTGAVIGGFASQSWARASGFFGTGENFIFRLSPDPLHFPWVPGGNNYFQSCNEDRISFGGGSGNGLTLMRSLVEGVSDRCETFNNEPLTHPNTHFHVTKVEVYGIANS